MRVIGIQDHLGTDGLTGVRAGARSPFQMVEKTYERVS